MKRAGDVGRDFDEYATAWRQENYGLEVGFGADGVEREEGSAAVQVPGDEWGDIDGLRRQYGRLVDRLALPDRVNVVEIGAGGGRSTAALLDVLGERTGEYHVIDVSETFVETLKARVTRPIETHIVSDVDVSFLPDSSADLVIAQSSWSHINLYDQYRYLRDLRRVLARRAPLVVNGIFLLGTADDWTWNRFRRRVYQIDHELSGVYHEFTSLSASAEMLNRLRYRDITFFPHAMIARRGGMEDRPTLANVKFGYSPRLDDWLDGAPVTPMRLPRAVAPAPPPTLVQRVRRRLGGRRGNPRR